MSIDSAIGQVLRECRAAVADAPRVYVEIKGGRAGWYCLDSLSATNGETAFVQRIWDRSRGGRVGSVVELPAAERSAGETRAPLPSADPLAPDRYVVFQRIDERGEILLRLRSIDMPEWREEITSLEPEAAV